jgi:hypothetical protein
MSSIHTLLTNSGSPIFRSIPIPGGEGNTKQDLEIENDALGRFSMDRRTSVERLLKRH